MTVTVGIAGITGKVAYCTARQLLLSEDVLVRGYGRDIGKVPKALAKHPRAKLYQGLVDDEGTLRSFAKGCDVMICTYFAENDVMYDAQKLLIDISEEEGVGRYIASDYTAEYPSLELGQFEMKDPMLKIRDYLNTKTIQAVHILTGLFMETLFSEGLFYWDPEKSRFSFYGNGDEVIELSSYHTTGQRIAAVALDNTANGFLRFRDDRVTTNEIISAFTKVYGRAPNVKRLGSLEDLEAKALVNGKEDYISTAIYWIFSGRLLFTEPIDNDRYTWIKPITIDRFFHLHSPDQLRQALPNVIAEES